MIIEHLKKELEARSRKNPNYSLRSFARTLEVDSSTLSAILRGKRPLSAKMAKKILEKLELSMEDKTKLFSSSMGVGGEKADDSFFILDNHALEFISGWEHYAILSVLELTGFQGTVTAIAKRLNLGTGAVLSALNRLERLKLARRTGKAWVSTGKQLTTSQRVPNAVLRRVNREYIERAIYSMEHHETNERDITGITMAISLKKLPEAYERIKEFRRSLCKFLESGDREEVYRLNLQLFPLKR